MLWVMLLCSIATLSLSAQPAGISVSVKDVTVKELLKQIEAQSGYTFAYANSQIPLDRRVSVNAVDMSVEAIIAEVMPEVSVRTEDKKILLSPRKKNKDNKKEKENMRQTVTGTVYDENGEPVIGATVMQRNTSNAVTTDIDGHFTINVGGSEPTIRVSYIGYTPSEVKAIVGKPMKIKLKGSGINLDEVVVTALGITREQKSLGYAVSKVSSDELNNSVSGNWLNNLNGKVAGLSTVGGASGPTGSMRVVLRGDQSLNYGSNEALFVVDGVPVSSGDVGTGSGGMSNTDATVDFGNGASEINPEDVESVSVLKGPAATALYGSRAANGAIVITTKSGRDTKGVGVTVNSSVTFEKAMRFPKFQKVYGPGNDNGYKPFAAWNFSKTEAPEGFESGRNASRYSYGEAFGYGKLRNQFNSYNWLTGEYTLTPFEYADDWYSGIYETGTTYKNNVTLTSNNGKGTSARVLITDTRNSWIMPNTGYQNQTVSASFSTKMGKWVKFNAKVNYLHKTSDNTPVTGYSTSSPTYYIVWGLTSNSMRLYKDEYFSGRVNSANYNGGCKDGLGMVNSLGNSQPGNPYHQLYEATNSINKSRVYGAMNLTISFPVKGLTLDLRGGTDISADFRQQQKPFYTPGYKSGFYREQNNRDEETNIDFLLKYVNNRMVGTRLAFNAAFGGNNMSRSVYRSQITLDKLGEPGVYNSSNTPTGETSRPYQWRSKKVVNSFYGFISASWDDTYFLDLTARNDWSSTLGRGNWSFFYPSVSASVLLDKTLNLQDVAPQVNMLKLRASWANVGNDTSPYSLTDAYTASSTYPGGYTYPTNCSNYYIKPENVESWEGGIETMFFMNRFGFDVAFYNSSTTNQIVNAVTDLMTGASSKKINAGEIRNRGIEIALHAVPVRSRDFTWSIDINWSRNWNKLVSLEDGWDIRTPYEQTKNLIGNYGRILSYIGEEMNIIYGRGYERAPEGATYIDADGNTVNCAGMKIITESTGYPVMTTDNIRLGKVNPTWRGGLGTTLRYRDFILGLNFTAQMGGHAYSFTNAILAYQGKLENSLPGRNDGLVVEGVNVSTDAEGNTVYKLNRTPTEQINKYYTTYFARDNAEENVFKTDFLKLKEMRLDYTLPRKVCRKLKVLQGAAIGAYATNVFCISDFPQFDPEAGNIVGTNIYSGIEIGAMPMTRTYGFNLKLSF